MLGSASNGMERNDHVSIVVGPMDPWLVCYILVRIYG